MKDKYHFSAAHEATAPFAILLKSNTNLTASLGDTDIFLYKGWNQRLITLVKLNEINDTNYIKGILWTKRDSSIVIFVDSGPNESNIQYVAASNNRKDIDLFSKDFIDDILHPYVYKNMTFYEIDEYIEVDFYPNRQG